MMIYHQINPDISVSVTGGGSGTGIAALMNGTVDIANASRSIKPEEIEIRPVMKSLKT